MKFILLGFLVFLSACASVVTQKPSLSGKWLLTTNSGDIHIINIRQLSPKVILVDAEKTFLSGRYQIDNRKISLIEANQPRISNIEFTLAENGKYYITKVPSAARMGVQLKGGSLTRIE